MGNTLQSKITQQDMENNIENKGTMSSLEIAEATGKQHSHIMRDIRNILEQGVDKSNFGLMFRISKLGNSAERKDPYYELTYKGCLILASGYDALLREKIINRWEELETGRAKPNIQIKKEDKAIDTKRAALYWDMAKSGMFLPKYSQILGTYAANTLAGKNILPLPISEKNRYTAGDIGKILGISANKVGRLAKEHEMKTDEYGEWVEDKSAYSGRQVRNFEYYENAIPAFRNLLS